MAIKITTIDEAIENNGLKCLIHGPAGTGKTTLCATTGSPTLIISAEGGLLSLKGAPDYIKTVKVETMADMSEVFDLLNDAAEEDRREYDWVMLDSISEIAEVVLAKEKENSRDPRQAYGALIEQMIGFMKAFRDMPHYNVLMTCKQTQFTDDYSGITRFIPSMPGSSLQKEIAYLFDEVFVARVDKDEEGKDVYRLQTQRDIQYEAKDRSGELSAFEPPSLKKILEKIDPGFVSCVDQKKPEPEPEEQEVEEQEQSDED